MTIGLRSVADSIPIPRGLAARAKISVPLLPHDQPAGVVISPPYRVINLRSGCPERVTSQSWISEWTSCRPAAGGRRAARVRPRRGCRRPPAQLFDKLRLGLSGCAGGEQVVVNEHPRSGRDRTVEGSSSERGPSSASHSGLGSSGKVPGRLAATKPAPSSKASAPPRMKPPSSAAEHELRLARACPLGEKLDRARKSSRNRRREARDPGRRVPAWESRGARGFSLAVLREKSQPVTRS